MYRNVKKPEKKAFLKTRQYSTGMIVRETHHSLEHCGGSFECPSSICPLLCEDLQS